MSEREQLLTRARQVADSRMIAGVHYTGDTLAGSALGDLIFTATPSQTKVPSGPQYRGGERQNSDKLVHQVRGRYTGHGLGALMPNRTRRFREIN